MSNELKGAFEYYYQTLKHGTYIAAIPSEESIKSIVALQKRLRLKNPVPAEDLHATIVYSKRGNADIRPNMTYKTGIPLGFELFGDDKNYLVLELESDDLSQRHEQCMVYGLSSTYDEYRPHITLSTNYQDEDIDDELLYNEKGEAVVLIEFETEIISPLNP